MQVGIITAPHGIRGQVKIRCLISPQALLACKTLSDANGKQSFRITQSSKPKDDILIIAFDGISDRDTAEALQGTALFATADQLPKKTAREEACEVLPGLEARLVEGDVYGRVTGVYNFGAGEVIEIELTTGKTEMLPFNENFIGDIQAAEGYVTVFPPEYLEAK